MKLSTLGACLVSLALCATIASANAGAFRPITLGETLPDFALASLQGPEVRLSSLRGKNVVLVFPRVQYQENQWCAICNYAYLELVQLDQVEGIRKAYNAEILVMVPFGAEVAQAWLDATPALVAKVNAWKHPDKPENLDAGGKAFVDRARLLFPADLTLDQDRVPTPFPIVLDPERAVTGGLGLFQTEWGGTRAEQQIPTIMILDAQGVVRFKHMGQDTFDRPSARTIAEALREVARGSATIAQADRDALIAASLDYVEGWYQGDPERMRRALHPGLAKRALKDQAGQESLWHLTRDDLLKKTTPTPMGPDGRVDITLLDVGDHIATAKVVSPRFVDYVHFVRQDGRWTIVNVVWE